MKDEEYKQLCDSIDEWVRKKRAHHFPELYHLSTHPLWDKIESAIVHIMIKYGPDGHCDGAEYIAGWILENFKVLEEKRRR